MPTADDSTVYALLLKAGCWSCSAFVLTVVALNWLHLSEVWKI